MLDLILIIRYIDMLFSFGKKASNNVMNTANQLKDVIEKKVN